MNHRCTWGCDCEGAKLRNIRRDALWDLLRTKGPLLPAAIQKALPQFYGPRPRRTPYSDNVTPEWRLLRADFDAIGATQGMLGWSLHTHPALLKLPAKPTAGQIKEELENMEREEKGE